MEGVWLGAAVTLFPVPMTELQFPPQLEKECKDCEGTLQLIPPTVPVSLFDSLCGLVTHAMLLFCLQLA